MRFGSTYARSKIGHDRDASGLPDNNSFERTRGAPLDSPSVSHRGENEQFPVESTSARLIFIPEHQKEIK